MVTIYISGTCSIYLLEFEKANAFYCGHVFCHKCAMALKKCGLCRLPFNGNINPLFHAIKN
jgi:hypothetical protein